MSLNSAWHRLPPANTIPVCLTSFVIGIHMCAEKRERKSRESLERQLELRLTLNPKLSQPYPKLNPTVTRCVLGCVTIYVPRIVWLKLHPGFN